MKHPTLHEPSRTPQPGIDRSINQDDDAEHARGADATKSSRDVLSGADARNRPGLVDNEPDRASSPTQVDFDFGAERERRRH